MVGGGVAGLAAGRLTRAGSACRGDLARDVAARRVLAGEPPGDEPAARFARLLPRAVERAPASAARDMHGEAPPPPDPDHAAMAAGLAG